MRVGARRARAVTSTPLWLMRLDALPPLAPSTVQKDRDRLLAGELLLQIVVEFRRGGRHDEQASQLPHPCHRLLQPEPHVHLVKPGDRGR